MGGGGGGGGNRVYCIHVSGHDPLTFLSCPLSFFDWVGALNCALGPPRPLFPCVHAVAGGQSVRAAASASDSWESLHWFLVGANKSYVIYTIYSFTVLKVSIVSPLALLYFKLGNFSAIGLC